MDTPHSIDGSIRVLVADDHPFFRAGISERINRIGEKLFLAGEAEDGDSAYKLAGALKPQVILMDVNMPSVDGISATAKIKRDYPEIKIIALSASGSVDDVKAILQAGADGYLLKTVTGKELHEAIVEVMAGGSVLTPAVARELIQDLNKPNQTATKLSDRELQILKLAADGASNERIARELFLSVRTVEAHFHHIFQKIEVSSRTEAVVKALKLKLI